MDTMAFLHLEEHRSKDRCHGMHEILAPILWVVERDAIEAKGGKTESERCRDLSRQLQRQRLVKDGVSTVAHTIRTGDRGGSGSSVSISEDR